MGFIEIAKSGSIRDWEDYVNAGNDPNELDQYGTTPLTWIVKLGALDLFQYAIERGADPFFPYRNGGSVFFDLLSQNKTQFLEKIVSLKNHWRNSKHLLNKNKDGNLIFHELIHFSDEDLWENFLDLIEPEHLSSVNEEGRTIFLEAVTAGNIGYLSAILDKNPEVLKQTDKDGKNALLLSAERNISEDVEYLLNIGFSIEEKDDLGNNALFLAASGDGVETMEILLSNGADLLVFGENQESITRMMDREKFSFSMKVWKKELYKRLKALDFEKQKPELEKYLTYLKKEKPLVEAEIAQAKLMDFL